MEAEQPEPSRAPWWRMAAFLAASLAVAGLVVLGADATESMRAVATMGSLLTASYTYRRAGG